MELQELFIGAWIHDIEENKDYQIEEIKFSDSATRKTTELGVVYRDGSFWSNIKQNKDEDGDYYSFCPVHLTVEWMNRFGFEKWSDVIVNPYEYFERWVMHNVIDGTSNFEIHIVSCSYGDSENCYIRYSIDENESLQSLGTGYVHNLQSCYFRVVGYEL